MVRIRFRRVGTRHQATYRIVAADRESPRDGRFLEVLGYYNPRTEPATVRVNERRLFHWMQHGAQPSQAVQTTLKLVGTWERWERLKRGEALEAVLGQAEQAMAEFDSRTRRDDLVGSRRRKRRRMEAEGAQADKGAGEATAGGTGADLAEEPVAGSGTAMESAQPAAGPNAGESEA
jgi:small subunit ribosomal protein S16